MIRYTVCLGYYNLTGDGVIRGKNWKMWENNNQFKKSVHWRDSFLYSVKKKVQLVLRMWITSFQMYVSDTEPIKCNLIWQKLVTMHLVRVFQSRFEWKLSHCFQSKLRVWGKNYTLCSSTSLSWAGGPWRCSQSSLLQSSILQSSVHATAT